MQFTPVAAAALNLGNYIRFTHEGTTYIGRLIDGTMAMRAEVKGHPEFIPVIVERRADTYENLGRRFAPAVTNVQRITFEPGDEVEFVFGGRSTPYEGRLYNDGASSFLRADVSVSGNYMPNIVNPRTNVIAGAVSDLWPTNIKESRPAESTSEVESLRTRVAELESRLSAQQVDAEGRLNNLRHEVGMKAMTLAREHDWCEVVDGALRELGIEPPQTETRMTVTAEFEIVATTVDPRQNPSVDWVISSLVFGEGEEGTIGLDSDWENVTVNAGTVVSIDIEE